MDRYRRGRARRLRGRHVAARAPAVSPHDGDVMPRLLVAGIGNIFLGDDGFGSAVARRMNEQTPVDGVDVVDFGIRGIHLAYELAGGKYDAAILVDAVSRGGTPGTLYAIEPADHGTEQEVGNGHSVTPTMVLSWVRKVGGQCGRVLVVGCEAASVEERMALSSEVASSVDAAVEMIRGLVVELMEHPQCA
jgi:hydrogenase maturation protease